jgi:CheY-like chemotaxis protein
MKKVLVNLLSNAYKFTDGTGRITVSAWEWDGSIAVCVEDDGIGLQSDDIQRIFEAFVQVDSSLSRKQQGAGLGLALSRKLVELHGGRIWAESPGPGQGSAFTFVIPRGGPPEKSREARRVGAGDRLAERPHVMVLEDPSFAGDLISQYLMDVGYRVARCPELHEALAIAKKVKPIAVVVDAMLPARRCLGALEELKQLPETQDALVVAISGSEEDNASACPQVDLRVKPLDLDRLLKALRSVELCSRGEGRSPEVS